MEENDFDDPEPKTVQSAGDTARNIGTPMFSRRASLFNLKYLFTYIMLLHVNI